MSKRKEDLAKKLGGDQQTPGWKEQIGASSERTKLTSSASYKRKTYLLTPEMVERIKSTAVHHKVGQNELVRFLLNWSLDQLDQGALELPLEETYRIKS